MKTCKTCIHWKEPKHDGYSICHPYDFDTGEHMQLPFKVRQCTHPKLAFCERPVESDGFAVADGSTYMADFYTAEEFGCVKHESA